MGSAVTIDLQASTVTLRTRAKGMLSRLAHDLEIDASRFEGEVELDGDAWKATLRFDVHGLRVTGALKGERVDRAILSPSDRAEIEKRIVTELPGGTITVTASGTDRRRGEATIVAPRGEQTLGFGVTVEERRDGETVAQGKLSLSLKRLGVKEIKGPLGAFRVDDSVEVAFWMMLKQAE